MTQPIFKYLAATFGVFVAGMLTYNAYSDNQSANAEPYPGMKAVVFSSFAGNDDRQALALEKLHSANAITKIDIKPQGVEIVTHGNPDYRYFFLDNGKKLVLDFENTINLISGEIKKSDAAPESITQVRTSQFAIEPNFISRLVVDLESASKATIVGAHDKVTSLVITSNNTETFHVSVRSASEIPNDSSSVVSEDIQPYVVKDSSGGYLLSLVKQLDEARQVSHDVQYNDETQDEEHSINASWVASTLGAVAPVVTAGQSESSSSERGIGAPDVDIPTKINRLIDSHDIADTLIFAASDNTFGYVSDSRMARLMQELVAVGEVDVDVSLRSLQPYDAVLDDEEVADLPVIEDAEPVDVSDSVIPDVPAAPPVETPLPPAPREVAPAPVTTLDANREVAERLLELQRAEMTASAEASEPQVISTPERRPYTGDPLLQPVTIDFRDMELSNAVALLAHKAGINVIAGIDLRGTVTANLREVPLRQAMETALRMNGLGLMEEEGIYHIVPYEDAISARRKTVMVHLENAKADDVRSVLDDIIAASPDRGRFSLSANEPSNVVIISGPEKRIDDLVDLARNLDISEVVLPTITEAIQLNYSEPSVMVTVVEKMLTPEIGMVSAEERARHLVITDIPVVVEQIRDLIKRLDIPVKQVNIDAMVLDVVLDDSASTGVDWVLDVVRRQSRRQAALGDDGTFVGNLQELAFDADLGIADPAGIMSFGLLSSRFDWRGMIQAELRNSNTHLVSNPKVITVENRPARITISQEIPYVELTQTDQGGQQTSTQFKDIGTILEVTPRVTHDDYIIVDITGKESNTAGVFNNIPIENKREIETTTRVFSGQTIFIGGLRKNSDNSTVRKVPLLGDLPVLSVLFRQNLREETATELLIFLTCSVVHDDMLLPAYQQERFDMGERAGLNVNAGQTLFEDILKPAESGDPTRSMRRGN